MSWANQASNNQAVVVSILEDNAEWIVISYEFDQFKRRSVNIEGKSFVTIELEGK